MSEQRTGLTADDALERRLAALTPAQRALLERVLARDGAAPGVRRRPDTDDGVPLSFEQERLWFMNELVSYRAIFHVPVALRLRGGLDVPALRRALARLVARHETLRTVFRDTSAGPRQVVRDEVEVPLPVEDCSGAADPGQEARTRASASVGAPFDLRTGPLLRCVLYRIAPDDHLFLLTQHHIVSDYWSLGILLGDLGALYADETGRPTALPPQELHYPDFAHWQRTTLDPATIDRHLAYWRDRLAGVPELLELPTDRPRPAIRSSQGAFHHLQFPGDLVARLRDLAKEESTTLNVVFLAAYFALLSRLVRQDVIVVGVPVAGRSRPELQRMVGYFLNWLAIRVDVGDRPSLRKLVRRTAEALTEAMTRQDVPFDMLVSELQPTRRPGVTPVFQTSFSLRDGAPTPPGLPGADVAFADLDGGATHFDLMAELWCEDDRVVGYLPYDDELFDASTVASYAQWLTRLAEAAAFEPDRPVTTLSLLTEAEQAELVGPGPLPPEGTGQTLHARFAEQVRRRPEAPAVSDGTTELTYRELNERADRIAHVLRRRGVGLGTAVGVVLGRTVDLPAAVLGVLKTGAAYLPVDPDSPVERTAAQFADCAVTTALVTGDLLDRLPADLPEPVVLDRGAPELAEAPAGPADADVPATSPAYIIHTSGSTGAPKGVVVSHGNALRLFTAAWPLFDLGEHDVWTLFHSCSFDFSVWELWGALAHGGRLVVVPQWVTRAPDAFAELLQRENVTVLSQTPSAFGQLSRVLLDAPRPLALRYVVFGGEALDLPSLRDWTDVYGDEAPRLVNMYGITETTVHVTFRRITRADTASTRSLIGRPLPDLALYLLDDELRPVPPGIPGEIFVGGAGVALGYHGAAALTAQRMLPDPYSPQPGARMYRSGDLAVRLKDGELAYLGRLDHQYKIRGHRVETGEVQTALGRLDEVAESAVLVTDDRVRGKTLVAYVVPEPGRDVTPTRIRRELLRTLPDWLAPSSVVLLDSLPLTRNGKLDRQALAARRRDAGRERTRAAAPQGPTAVALAAIWAELLGVDHVGAEDDFFELGGHSLMVVHLVSTIRTRLGVEVPLDTLFRRPELQAMADEVDHLTAGSGPAAPDSDAAAAQAAAPAEPGSVGDGLASSSTDLRAVRAGIGSRSPADGPGRGAASAEPGSVGDGLLTSSADLRAVWAEIGSRLAAVRPPGGAAGLPAGEHGTVLLTGATGFVGAFLLAELAESGAHVVCLLRGGADRRDGLVARLRELGLWRDRYASRIEVVGGDIGRPLLGLAPDTYRDLCERVGRVVHAAAWVNHIYPYDRLAEVNAHSAAALLAFAATTRRKSLTLVSTSAVFEATDLPEGSEIGAVPVRSLPGEGSGYVRSKAVAELYAEHAGDFGVPAVVVRIPSVFGDRRLFQINTSDAIWSWTSAMLVTGRYPRSFDDPDNELFQALPADFAARAIAGAGRATDEPGCRIVNAIPRTVGGTRLLLDGLRAAGHDPQPMPDRQWYGLVGRLDTREIWVAGIATHIARRPDTGAPRRRLHRFSPAPDPDVARLVDAHAIRSPADMAGYIGSLTGSGGSTAEHLAR
ncbi:non-ribosomal peptide synthetase [Streptomyces olivaceus]|nr:non-ribosomal peptide synthetase [Streptomyces olivaceus]